MIDRYSTEEMRRLWSLQKKFETWKDIEVYACEYWHSKGKISADEMKDIRQKSHFTVKRTLEIENEVHHDVIAFLTNMAENIGPASRFVHFGLTSSDVVDTGLSYLLVEAGNLLLGQLKSFANILYSQSKKYKDLIVVGRTHGVHAEPTTLGLKLLGYFEETKRNYLRLEAAVEEISYGKISGAVGSYSQLPPELEEYVLTKMNLKAEPVSTQVIPRDRHANFLNAVSMTAQGLARLAQEIRLLQKTESREVEEPFQAGQKGSSAMPHKRNPILCERICGLARVLLGYAQTAQQDIGLWHERDISHSSAERVILPDATSLLQYMLIKFSYVIENLHVYENNCQRVLESTGGLLYSSRALLVITEELKLSREEAYSLVQKEAMNVWADSQGPSLKERLESHDEIKKIATEKWNKVFEPKDFLQNIDKIFSRCSEII